MLAYFFLINDKTVLKNWSWLYSSLGFEKVAEIKNNDAFLADTFRIEMTTSIWNDRVSC